MVAWRHTSLYSMNLSDLVAKRFLGVNGPNREKNGETRIRSLQLFCFCASDEKVKRKNDNVSALVRFVREPAVGWVETYRFFRIDHR